MFHPNVQEHIDTYLASQPDQKRGDLELLHALILRAIPSCKMWFDDGLNEDGKVVTNPTIGYGLQILKYSDGKTKAFFQIGLCATKTGISIYILGLADKTYLAQTYGKDLGKASVTGYCIKFKQVKDISLPVLEAAIRYGVEATSETNLTA
jgi:hypothetical protein